MGVVQIQLGYRMDIEKLHLVLTNIISKFLLIFKIMILKGFFILLKGKLPHLKSKHFKKYTEQNGNFFFSTKVYE
jgi:hypothetical protein